MMRKLSEDSLLWNGSREDEGPKKMSRYDRFGTAHRKMGSCDLSIKFNKIQKGSSMESGLFGSTFKLLSDSQERKTNRRFR